jgi:CHAD domain-containing protein
MTDSRAQRADPPVPQANPSGAKTARASAALTPRDPFILLAYATLQRELMGLVAARPRRPSAPTPHEVHQLRVAARRLRVALKLFRHLLPSGAVRSLRDDLRTFARALGEVRDLDVYMHNFRAYAEGMSTGARDEIGAYELYLRRERADARNRMAAVFASSHYPALVDAATRLVGNGPNAGALRRWRSLSVRTGVRQSLRKSVSAVRKLGNRLVARATPRELHALRIRAKRLRYELEFFSHVYPSLKKPATALKQLQDLLGEHQDACEATARLRRYAAAQRKQDPAASGLPPALAELRRGQLRRARGVRTSFAARWPEFLAAVGDVPRAAE